MNSSKIHSIEDGVHELRFGESWDSQACVDYHALQYSFKPQSASRIGTGTLQLDNNVVHFSSPSRSMAIYAACAPSHRQSFLFTKCYRAVHPVLRPRGRAGIRGPIPRPVHTCPAGSRLHCHLRRQLLEIGAGQWRCYQYAVRPLGCAHN